MTPRGAMAPWLAALIGIAISLWLFYPGYLSWDSAYAWYQARHGQYDGSQPPMLAMLWHALLPFWPGPGGVFVLQIVLLWSALAAVASALPRSARRQAGLVLALGFWPPLFGLAPHLWKDLWTLIGFAWAIAFALREQRAPHRAWRMLAWLAIVFACAFRYNAITGALPLLAWLVWRDASARAKTAFASWRVTIATALLAIVVMAVAGLPGRAASVRQVDELWSAVTLWDAASVSLQENRLIFPPELVEPSLTLAELRAHYLDYSNTTVFETGKLKLSFDAPYNEAQRAALNRLTLDLPLQHSRAYFRHRLRLSQLLFGLDRAGLPDDQVLMPGIVVYGDNPALRVAPSTARATVQAGLSAAIHTPLFAGWLYLLFAAVTMLIAGGSRRALAAVTAASALAYALPLCLVSGSAEFRYLAWPILATLLALVLLANPRDRLRQR